MLKYLVKRIGTAVITLFVAATITFFVMNLVPGDPFMSEKAPTAAAKAAMLSLIHISLTAASAAPL